MNDKGYPRRRDTPRASRYPIRAPLRYRLEGASGWSEGFTENFSRSGVLFRGENSLEAGNPVEMTIEFPRVRSLEASLRVVCAGVIVRTARPTSEKERAVLAVAISRYHMERRDPPLEP